MGSVTSTLDLNRFRGFWYDLAGIGPVDYAYAKLTLTPTESLIVEEYDSKHILRKAYNGVMTLVTGGVGVANSPIEAVGAIGAIGAIGAVPSVSTNDLPKVQMTTRTIAGSYTVRYNILHVDYDNFALIESEDGSIRRVLYRRPQILYSELPTLREQIELVGWDYDRVNASAVVLQQ